MKNLVLALLAAVALLVVAGCGDDSSSNPDASTDTDTDSDADTDTDNDTDSDIDTDTYTESNFDSDAGCDIDLDGGPETDTCAEADAGTSADCVRYVDIDVVTSGDGLSWVTAFMTVQEGIDAAYATLEPCERCQIWIAEGIYYVYVDGTSDTIELKPGIELYGGFAGTETSLDERDWEAHVATLNGHEYAESENQVTQLLTFDNYNVIDGLSITGSGGTMRAEHGVFSFKNSNFYANESSLPWYGSALFCNDGVFTISNTQFDSNTGGSLGVVGGVLQMNNCTISGEVALNSLIDSTVSNSSFLSGAMNVRSSCIELQDDHFSSEELFGTGIFVEENSYLEIVGSYFEGGGPGLESEDSVVHVSDAIFVGNSHGKGGGASIEGDEVSTFTNCLFYNNTASESSGALYGQNVTVDGCVFLNNNLGDVGGVGGRVRVRDSLFSMDKLVACEGSRVSRSVLAGSSIASIGDSVFEDTVVVGSGDRSNFGCGDWQPSSACPSVSSEPLLKRMTLVGSVYDGVEVGDWCDAAHVRGSILWDNGAIYGPGTAKYSLVPGGYPGEGNISSNPLFVGYPASTGTWSDAYFDEAMFQTELTDETASWEPGELAGLFVMVSPLNRTAAPIADNTETTIWAWGNTMAYTEPGNSYQILDLHLQSGSPAIDSGYGLGASALDVEGNARYDDPAATNAYDCGTDTDCVEYADMGAYERQP